MSIEFKNVQVLNVMYGFHDTHIIISWGNKTPVLTDFPQKLSSLRATRNSICMTIKKTKLFLFHKKIGTLPRFFLVLEHLKF